MAKKQIKRQPAQSRLTPVQQSQVSPSNVGATAPTVQSEGTDQTNVKAAIVDPATTPVDQKASVLVENAAIKAAQSNSMIVVKTDPVTKKKITETVSYQSDLLPVEKERGLFHVELEKIMFDKQTGERLSKAFVQKFTIEEWALYQSHIANQGHTIKVLWNPKSYKG